MNLELIRDPHQPPTATLGRLIAEGGRTFYTIERPWIPNEHGGQSGDRYRSCIAEGEYRIIPHETAAGERCWALVNPMLDVYYLPADVPNGREEASRTLVLIQTAFFVRDVIGSIGPGKQRAKHRNEWGVTDSRIAMNELRQLLSGKLGHTLTVRRHPAA